MPLAPGQGKPLPESLKCAGEWVIEDHVFLYFPDGQLATGPRFTRGASREDGRSCIGFDVEQLATAFDLDVPSILAANREGTLVCRGTAKTPPTHGGSSATTYAFQIRERNAYLKVEINDNAGAA